MLLRRTGGHRRSTTASPSIRIHLRLDASVLELVNARGYAIAELNNVLFRGLDATESVAVPYGVEIRRGRPEEAGKFSDILTRCFFEKGDAPQGFADMLSPLFRFPQALTFLACINGTIVAAAAGRIIPEQRILALFGAGTLPEHRGRGIQNALLRTRMKAAAESGCELVVVVTRGGSTSERNCRRLGFQVAYSKATVIKLWDKMG